MIEAKKQTLVVPKRSAIYTRVSTEMQVENFSLAGQLELLRKFSKDLHMEIYHEYVDEGFTGKQADRPSFQKLLQDAKQRKFDVVLVYKVDRFFRNNKELLIVCDYLQQFGIGIRSITEPFDTTTYMGRFMLSMLGSIAELERSTFIERSKLGRIRRAKEGFYGGCSRVKFGYQYDKEKRLLGVGEKEAAIVRLIFSAYNKPDSSLLKVAKKLRSLGYKTREGNEFAADTIHAIVVDPIYIGKWFANRNDASTGKLKPESEWIEVPTPRIVSDEQFETAKKFLLLRKKYSERNVKYNYLLQGLCRCGDCGCTIAGAADKQYQMRSGKQYGPYYTLYYRCTNFVKNKYDKTITCNLKYLRGEILENVVWTEIRTVLQNPSLIREMVRRNKKCLSSDEHGKLDGLNKLSKEIAQIEREEQRILEAYRQDVISIEQLKEQLSNINNKKKAIENHKKEYEQNIQSLNIHESRLEKAIDFAKNLGKELDTINFEGKKRILRILQTRVVPKVDGEVDLECRIPTDKPDDNYDGGNGNGDGSGGGNGFLPTNRVKLTKSINTLLPCITSAPSILRRSPACT